MSWAVRSPTVLSTAGVRETGAVITDISEIALDYLRSWFLVDLVSAPKERALHLRVCMCLNAFVSALVLFACVCVCVLVLFVCVCVYVGAQVLTRSGPLLVALVVGAPAAGHLHACGRALAFCGLPVGAH